MLVEHRGKRPTVHASAWIAPTAVICGDVHVNGAQIGREAFVATRAALFPGARVGVLDFPGTVYGQERGDDLMARVMPRQAAWLGAHRDDRVL